MEWNKLYRLIRCSYFSYNFCLFFFFQHSGWVDDWKARVCKNSLAALHEKLCSQKSKLIVKKSMQSFFVNEPIEEIRDNFQVIHHTFTIVSNKLFVFVYEKNGKGDIFLNFSAFSHPFPLLLYPRSLHFFHSFLLITIIYITHTSHYYHIIYIL